MNKWDLEPDEINFDYSGYACLIKKIPRLLNLCGYVLIPKEHFLYDKSMDELNEILDVHGGITFNNYLTKYEYFIGFDCGHAGDIIPEIHRYMPELLIDRPNWSYKDSDYVRNELKSLVDQIIILGRGIKNE